MRTLNKKNFKNILTGANLLGTGGGGTIKDATQILKSANKDIKLVSINELGPKDIMCSIFGVGGKQKCNAEIASQIALSLFQQYYNKKISAIVPVEVGPVAMATSLLIACKLGIPILDSDIVGLRSSPEIYLETISLANIDRTPCAIANDKGKREIFLNVTNAEELESLFRNFAESAGGLAFAAGYPMKVSDIRKVLPEGSVSIAEITGRCLDILKKDVISLDEFCKKENFILLGVGYVIEAKTESTGGFEKGTYIIQSVKNTFNVIFNNENLILLKNNLTILTCPDSICLLDISTFTGINNFENNLNKNVAILGKKAIPIWRTQKGKLLFSPKKLGFDYQQKLLI